MDINDVLHIIRDHGYMGLYFWLWFGAFAIPVPNEVIVSTIGFFAGEKVLVPWKVFLITYIGILSAVTTSYGLGRFAGKTVLLLFNKRSRFENKLEKALSIIDKYKTLALAFSYFVPGLRIIIPFLFGFSKLPYVKFAAILYTSVLLWVTIVFSVGYFAGEEFIDAFIKYYDIFIVVGGILLVTYVTLKIKKTRNMRKLSH